MVDRLTPPRLELGQDAPVAVGGVILDHLHHSLPEPCLFGLPAPGVLALLHLVVVPGALAHPESPKAPIEPEFFLVALDQAQLLLQGQ